MKTAKFWLGAAAAAALSTTASAQLSAPAPAAPDPSAALNGVVPPPPDPVGIAPQPFLPNGPTVWSRLGIDPVQREFYRRQAARTPLGQLRAKIREPFSKLTGGVIPPFAPKTPSVPELKDPGPVGAAAKAKLDRAGAEERIKAIKYLATLDCHYWPEAEEALIGALRADRNECVRYEAATALLNGCCCTCKVTVALSIAVSCSDADGNPTERSARVRAVAAHALDRCLSSACCAPELPPLVPVDPDKKPDAKGPTEGGEKAKGDDKAAGKARPGDAEYPKQYYAAVPRIPRATVVAMGRRALELGAQFGYDFTTPINDSDYVAAGLPAATSASYAGGTPQPTTLLELFAWNDSGAAIAQPALAPPTVVVSRPSPVRTALATAPLPAPAKELAPAPSPARLPAVVVGSPTAPESGTAEKSAAPVRFTPPAPVSPASVSATGMTAPKVVTSEPLKLPVVAVPAAAVPEVKPLRPAPTPAPLKLAAPTMPPAPIATAPIVPAPVVARKPTAPAVTVPTLPPAAAPATQAPAPVVSIPPVPTPPTVPATQAPAPVVPLNRPATEPRFPQEPSPLGGDYQPRGR